MGVNASAPFCIGGSDDGGEAVNKLVFCITTRIFLLSLNIHPKLHLNTFRWTYVQQL
jgi:hypothetical protein